jgi:hypothetical protein
MTSAQFSLQHIVVDIIRLEDGFVKYRDTFPGGPAAFFQDISQPTFLTKNILFAFQTMLGDGVLVCLNFHVSWKSMGLNLEKDLSLLRRLAIRLGYHPTKPAVVLRLR